MRPLLSKVKYLRGRKVLAVMLCILFVCAVVFFFAVKVVGRQSETTLRVNGRTFSLEVAGTPAAQELGLGKRASLPKNQGMLFVFSRPAVECFWMKDMHFPLDMIWLDANKTVVHVEQNVSPATYPSTFCPAATSEYVIELNAGSSRSAGIRDGEILRF